MLRAHGQPPEPQRRQLLADAALVQLHAERRRDAALHRKRCAAPTFCLTI